MRNALVRTGMILGLASRLGKFCTLVAIEDATYDGNGIRLRMWGIALVDRGGGRRRRTWRQRLGIRAGRRNGRARSRSPS